MLGEIVSECCSCFRALRRVFSRALVLDLGLHSFRWMYRGSYGRDLWSLWPQVAGAGLDLIVSPGRFFFFFVGGGGGGGGNRRFWAPSRPSLGVQGRYLEARS